MFDFFVFNRCFSNAVQLEGLVLFFVFFYVLVALKRSFCLVPILNVFKISVNNFGIFFFKQFSAQMYILPLSQSILHCLAVAGIACWLISWSSQQVRQTSLGVSTWNHRSKTHTGRSSCYLCLQKNKILFLSCTLQKVLEEVVFCLATKTFFRFFSSDGYQQVEEKGHVPSLHCVVGFQGKYFGLWSNYSKQTLDAFRRCTEQQTLVLEYITKAPS